MRYLLISVLLLAGCANFQPRLGMSYDEFERQCQGSNLYPPRLVAAEENVRVYTCDNARTVYAFEGSEMVKVSQIDVPAKDQTGAAILAAMGLYTLQKSQ